MKPLPQGNYLIRPFKTFKGFAYTYQHLVSSSSIQASVTEAIAPPVMWIWSGSSEPTNPNGLSKRSLYASVETLFYPSMSVSGTNLGHITATGSIRRPPIFPRGWSPGKHPNGIYIISVSPRAYGEQIRPNSFVIETTPGTASISDDGLGKLYASTDTINPIGNIFYSLGIAVIGKMTTTGSLTGSVISQEGIYLNTGSVLNIQYESQFTIYEHTVICTLEKDEFNYSTNPSLNLFPSSSVSGSTKLRDEMLSGSLDPYVTAIGLYNSVGEMMAIAKVPRAIKRAPEIDQTFIVKFDI